MGWRYLPCYPIFGSEKLVDVLIEIKKFYAGKFKEIISIILKTTEVIPSHKSY